MKIESKENRIKFKRRILIESLTAFFILVSPFVFKLHEFVSSDPEATLNFLGITITKNGFPNINVYIWFLLGKIVPLYLLLIWFFTCKQWWYHIILIPILMYAFQIFEGVVSENNYIDTENILWLLPFCMVVVPFVYFIRIKLYDKYVHGIDLEAMDAEIKVINNKQPSTVSHKTVKTQKEVSFRKETDTEDFDIPKEIGYRSLSEKINEKLSTSNLESLFRHFQNQLGNWLHLRF